MIKRKQFAVIIALMLCALFLYSCGNKDLQSDMVSETEVQTPSGTFVLISKETIEGTWIKQCIMYDPENMVMYTYLDGYNGGGAIVMYNADGTPKLYSPNGETN